MWIGHITYELFMNFISHDYLLAISDGTFFDMVNHDTEENDKGRRSPSVHTVRHQALLVTSLSVYSNTIFNIIKMKLSLLEAMVSQTTSID